MTKKISTALDHHAIIITTGLPSETLLLGNPKQEFLRVFEKLKIMFWCHMLFFKMFDIGNFIIICC